MTTDIKTKIPWNVEMEVSFFHAMHEHKPVGINRHFQMIFIKEKFNNSSNFKLTMKDINDQMNSLYDLNSLNDSERLPFPNKEIQFSLPNEESFQELIMKVFPRTNYLRSENESNSIHDDDKVIDKDSSEKDIKQAGESNSMHISQLKSSLQDNENKSLITDTVKEISKPSATSKSLKNISSSNIDSQKYITSSHSSNISDSDINSISIVKNDDNSNSSLIESTISTTNNSEGSNFVTSSASSIIHSQIGNNSTNNLTAIEKGDGRKRTRQSLHGGISNINGVDSQTNVNSPGSSVDGSNNNKSNTAVAITTTTPQIKRSRRI